MPPFKSIPTLTDVCSEWVWQWLIHCLNRKAAPRDRLRQRDHILKTLNPNIRQNLLNRVFSIHVYEVDLSTKCRLLELLGDRSTHCVDCSQCGSVYIDEAFHFYRTLTLGLLINLTKMGIICNCRSEVDKKYIPDVNCTVYRVLNQMRNLRWVTLGGIADSVMLGTLGMNCQHLEYLDVSDSTGVDDGSVCSLLLQDPLGTENKSLDQIAIQDLITNACCRTLTFVCISGTNVSLLSAVILLRYVSNLSSVGGYIEAGSVSSVVELLQDSEDEVQQFHLTHFWDTRINDKQASLLCLACPLIKTLTTGTSSLKALHNLHPLKSLTVELNYRGEAQAIYDYLTIHGESLKELILTKSCNCYLDMAWLMELTPNLECIEGSFYVEENDELPTWKCMREATVTTGSSKLIFKLLTHTPELRKLTLKFESELYGETCESLDDDLIINIVMDGGLRLIEKLSIKDCAITIKGLECLFLHCSHLTYLGQLIFWPNISQNDVLDLRAQVAQNNWQMKIVVPADW